MLPALHSAIGNLLYELGQLPAEVEVAFEQPTRAWLDARRYPALNFFLFDLQENTDLRQGSMQTMRGGDGRAMQRMPPRRFDLHYLVSAVSSAAADEYLLLWRALATLLRYSPLPLETLPGTLLAGLLRRDRPMPAALEAALREHLASAETLPAALLAELRAGLEEQLLPLATKVGRPADGPRAADLWSALDLPPRPALFYTVTAPVDLEIAFATPLVLAGPTRRFTRPPAADEAAGLGIRQQHAVESGTLTSIGGVVRDRAGAPLAGVSVSVAGRALAAVTDAGGRFRLDRLQPGPATLLIARPGAAPAPVKIEVPSESYDIVLEE